MTADSKFRERRSAHAEEEAPGEEPVREEPVEEIVEEPAPEPQAEPQPEPDVDEAEEAYFERLAGIEPPEARFLEIVNTLVVPALQYLGEEPIGPSGKTRVVPRFAKHFIDLLGILQERTEGNLPEDEARYLEDALADLRTRYLKAAG